MKQSTQTRFIRAFMSAVLASGLTRQELVQLLNAFPHDQELDFAMKVGLKAAIDALSSVEAAERGPTSLYHEREPEEDAYEIIKRRKLTKAQVLRVMELAGNRKSSLLSAPNLTLRETLSRFFASSSENEKYRFAELLEHANSKDDAFLKGILRDG